MIPQLDSRIAFVRELVDLRALLSELGIHTVREDGPELIAICPYHDDRNPSWSINSDRESERWGMHSCWSCKDEHNGGRGTVFNLVMHVRRCSFKQALQWIEKTFGIDASTDRVLDLSLEGRIREVRRRKPKRSGHSSVAHQFEALPSLKQGSAEWRYLERRGLTRKQILDSKARKGVGRFVKRVVFPIFKGLSVVNFYARHITNGKPKGLNATGKGLVGEALFNMHKADPMNGTCHLSEGVFDALAIERAGGVNSFPVSGGVLLPGHVSLLRPYRRVVIVDDQEGGGGVSLVPSCKRLLQSAELFSVSVPKGKDPDSTDPREMQRLLASPRPLRRSRVQFVVDYSLPR